MYPTRLVPPCAGVTPRSGEEPRPQGAGPQTGAPPNSVSGRRARAGTGRSHLLARLSGRPGALPRTPLDGEG